MWLIGSSGLFAFTALVHFFMILFVVYRLRHGKVAPVKERISFDDAMHVGLTVLSVNALSHTEIRQKIEE